MTTMLLGTPYRLRAPVDDTMLQQQMGFECGEQGCMNLFGNVVNDYHALRHTIQTEGTRG
jgi:hypothetical protein